MRLFNVYQEREKEIGSTTNRQSGRRKREIESCYGHDNGHWTRSGVSLSALRQQTQLQLQSPVTRGNVRWIKCPRDNSIHRRRSMQTNKTCCTVVRPTCFSVPRHNSDNVRGVLHGMPMIYLPFSEPARQREIMIGHVSINVLIILSKAHFASRSKEKKTWLIMQLGRVAH